MDEKTKLLQGFATRAREVAGKIHQPLPTNANTFKVGQEHDGELRRIEEQMLSVASAIDRYQPKRKAAP